MNSVRDVARWKGNVIARYVLASYWFFRVILEDVSPGLTDALQGKEMPFFSGVVVLLMCLTLAGPEEIPVNSSSLCEKSRFCFHQ